jgi:MFS family permease
MAVSSLTYPIIPLHIVGRGLGATVAGFVTATSSFVGLVSQVLWGYVGDAIGQRHKVMLIGGIAMVLFSVLGFLFAENIYGVTTVFILLGFGGSAIGVSSYALVADLSPGDLGKPMGWYWASASLGWALPLVFAGYLLKHYGIVSIYLIVLALSLALLALSIHLFISITPSSSSNTRSGKGFSAKPFANVLTNVRFLVLYISSLLFMVGDVVK